MALTTRKIEIVTDEDRYEGMALVKINTWEEFCEVAEAEEYDIALYFGDEWDGEFVSFNYYDEENPSQYDIRSQTCDWLKEEFEAGNENVKKWAEDYTDEDGDIDWWVFSRDYKEEWWNAQNENGAKLFMTKTEDGGPYGGKRGIECNSWHNDFTAYKVVDINEYMASLED